MCGIAGVFAYGKDAAPVDVEELTRIRDQMAPRGPDGKGNWIGADGRIGLAHRRLSIIDLSDRGAQPMASANGRLVITFNGEIYNYRAIRARLESKGYIFRSDSDTEVLLHLYEEQGEAMVGELRGMFAFAIWDEAKRGVFLARDPYGIKPLYYADDGETLRFASQVKALVVGGRITSECDDAGLAGFLLFGWVPDPYTTHRSISALPRGATKWIDGAGARANHIYFSLGQCYAEAEAVSPVTIDVRGLVREALLDSVRHHLVADVPVGAFLSAGIDSGSLVGLMRDVGQSDIQTITLSFDEYLGSEDDEAPLAAEVAASYGARHTTRRVGKRECQDDLPRIIDAMDQPSVDGINTWFVSKAANELGLKVAISGLGGDELFGGYSSFRDIPRLMRWMRTPSRVPWLGRTLRRAVIGLRSVAPVLPTKTASLVEYGGELASAYMLRRCLFMPWEIESLIGRERARAGLERLQPLSLIRDALSPQQESYFGKIASLESSIYMGDQLLRDTDWASLSHSVEVRVPLVDAELVRRLAPVTVRHQHSGKALLGESPSVPLPPSILRREKTGFSMPYQQWLAGSAGEGKLADGSVDHGAWSRNWAMHLASTFF